MVACLKKDASACIGMATRLRPGRLKHVEIKHFAPQHWVRQGRLNLDTVTTTEQLADIMTKPYSFQTLSTLAPKIGLTRYKKKITEPENSSNWIGDARKALTSISIIT